MSDLPVGWASAPLSAITSDVQQDIPQTDEAFSYIDIGAIDRVTKTIASPQTMLGKDAPSRARKRVAAGDTLVSMTRPNLNAVALVPPGLDGQIASTGFDVLRPLPGIDPRWLAYLVRTDEFVKSMSDLVQGALYPAVRSKDVRGHLAPVAPSVEQTRIADQLDTLLARINACNDRLEAIPGLLKRFRQAVRTAATTGSLTEEFRAARGIRNAWSFVPLGQLGELGRGKSKHRPRNDPRLYGGDIPFIQTGDVAQSSGWIREHSQTYSEFGLQQSKLWPAGTLCITIAANIADTALLAYPACFPDSVVGFVANPKLCEARFIQWSIDVIKDDLESFAPATAQKNINLGVLNDVQIRLPSLEEQNEIVLRVESLFQLADRIEVRHQAMRAHAQRLAPQVLAKAFRGELLPQDPNDEPAEALLARIADERASPLATHASPRPARKPRAAYAPKPSTAMTKSRQDKDVKGHPYLAGHLSRLGQPVSAEALFKVAELPVDDFYKQLAWEVAQGLVKDNTTTLEPGHAAG
jgi:type I restriction enzyme S subunit